MGYGVDGIAWWMPLAGVGMVLFWGAIVVWAVQSATHRGVGESEASRSSTTPQTRLHIANKRQDPAEISPEAFERVRRGLEAHRPSPIRGGRWAGHQGRRE